jgi:hypothetical protein
MIAHGAAQKACSSVRRANAAQPEANLRVWGARRIEEGDATAACVAILSTGGGH